MTQNFGILAIPPNASELAKHLVPRLMRTALEGTYDIDCENCERRQRALACLLVMCHFLAAVADSDDFVDHLSEDAKAYMREIEAMAAARGMAPDQLLKTAASDLELRSEQIPPDPPTPSKFHPIHRPSTERRGKECA
jgi:hypothetical protein